MSKRLAQSILSLSFVALLSVFAPAAHAQLNVCNPPQSIFQKLQDSFDRNIRETAINHATSLVVDWTFSSATGVELSEYMGCSTYLSEQMQGADLADMRNRVASYDCGQTDTTTCQNVMNQYAFDANGNYDRERFAQGKVSGSALGLAYALDNSLKYEPLPVNTAYFFKDYAYRLPIVGEKVLAADVDYRHTLINSVLGIWKITRNAAYALMAIIMLYVGITIIMRKQINQKVVVTVQYSLPKIILALVLIAFSYPIGALMASLAWSLFYSADDIIRTLGQASGAVDPTLWTGIFKSVGGILLLVLLFIISTGGISIVLVVLLVILAVVTIGLNVVANFKALMLYLKMLISIITAPITFAIGAIPGNEDKTMEWFKQMASYGLGVFAISVCIKLVHMFGVTAIRDSFNQNMFAGAMFGVFGFLFIFIYGYTFAIKAPEKIERAIMGPKKR
ncbi:hypothetical protein GYA27_03330 [candidate division WWE3 bacterium]|uniref:Type IV secretion system protein n=1 Tax=candidate division WWE3 bacterium TaxID=2053526 RepID=A0A7X9HGS4_UNCKA|nr:hypothetical protein [candidate division WWE3 bacterium]